jgi:glycosyltransferase involved in cell wall biosynthesis
MNIAFLVPDLEGPSTRYRVLKYIPYLRKKGWVPKVFVIQKGFLNRLRLLMKMRKFDIVVLHRKLFRVFDWYILRMSTSRLVYDFDDALMFRDPNRKNQRSYLRESSFRRTVRKSDIVIAGNEYLRGFAVQVNSETIVLPTSVDLERYAEKTAHQSDDIVLGWIGSSSTLIYLEKIKDILDVVYDRFPNVRLKIVSDKSIDCKKMPVIKKQWKSEEEITDLHTFDVGLMPLADDPWSRGKCGFKLLQYMAVGVPAVCSPVGVNREIVTDGVNGFWAEKEDEWIKKLSLLIRDSALRLKMGKKARETVIKHYSTEHNSKKLVDLLKHLY